MITVSLPTHGVLSASSKVYPGASDPGTFATLDIACDETGSGSTPPSTYRTCVVNIFTRDPAALLAIAKEAKLLAAKLTAQLAADAASKMTLAQAEAAYSDEPDTVVDDSYWDSPGDPLPARDAAELGNPIA